MVGSPNPKKRRKTIEKTFKNGGYHIKIDALKCLLAYADQFQDDDVASAMDDIVQRMKDTTSVLGAESVQRVIDMLSHQQRGDKGGPLPAGQSFGNTSMHSEMATETIFLTSSDGRIFEIDEAIASQSELLAPFFDDERHILQRDGEKLFSNVKGSILDLVIEYGRAHVTNSAEKDLKSWDKRFMIYNLKDHYALLMAADYLSFKGLVDLCFQTIADAITACKSPSEIRSKFEIFDRGYTDKEQVDVCTMNKWAFEEEDTYPPYSPLSFDGVCFRSDYIPDFMIEQILARMPAKSIARCRCVSKAWAGIISRPSFTAFFSSRRRTHLLFGCTEFPEKRTRSGVFFLSSPLPGTLKDLDSTLQTKLSLQTKLAPQKGVIDETYTSVNGLVFGKGEKILFHRWEQPVCEIHNPSTGKSITLPNLGLIISRKVPSMDRKLGMQCYFGYDPISKKFKVLSMITADNDGKIVRGDEISETHRCLTVRAGEDLSWRRIVCGIEHFPIELKPEAILFDYNGSLASFVLLGYLVSFELWVLEDRVKQRWVNQFHVIPDLPRDFSGDGLNFVGVMYTNETVWLESTALIGPITGMFFNIDSNIVKEISSNSYDELERRRLTVYVGHTEYLRDPWEDLEVFVVLESSEGEGVGGNIRFVQEGEECPTTVDTNIYGLKPGTYNISVDDFVLKTFDVDQNIPFTIKNSQFNIPLTGKKSVSIVTDGGRVVSKGDIKLPLLGRMDEMP
ncbi:hypothetical protein F2Q69_00042712 [Brassica cretica]|uniref:F-box domain-containing protein n=1 Tax=Brassica cretica TaxID=69181 RepID=A0A8S9NCW8_BRACR|nr:hypothetical protein F2Q69_00042712 [Brassica cretica]